MKFAKWQGAGNDFVVLDGRVQPIGLTTEQARRLADRHFGVGCDQILVIDNDPTGAADIAYQILNADGSSAQQCGNGARCVAAHVWKSSPSPTLSMRSPAGLVEARREKELIAVDMGEPLTDPTEIPFVAASEAAEYSVDVDGACVTIGAVSMGNPHAVTFVEDVKNLDLSRLGPALSRHEKFPQGANAGFARVVSATHLQLRVYERGVGETLACGSGACAAVVAGRIQSRLGPRVRVDLPGGTLAIYWEGPDSPVTMAGPATEVFAGSIEL